MTLPVITSETELINVALLGCGAQQIVDVDDASDDSREREIAAATYPILRDEVLAAHSWNCATAWVALTSDPTDTAALVLQNRRYAYAFTLPADCLRVLRTNLEEDGARDYWRIENFPTAKRLVYKDSTCIVEYVRRLTTPALMEPGLIQAIVKRCVAEWAEPLQDNSAAGERAMEAYLSRVADASGIDSQEGTPDDPAEDEHDIIAARA